MVWLSAVHAEAPNYQISTVRIPTRDAAILSATVVQPESSTKPLSVILFFTTYHQGGGDAAFGKKSVDRGYVGVVAYSRGIPDNLQNYQPFVHDGHDVYDLINWISKQPWCDGRVAMYGGSYTGFVQWATAKRLHPALKTIVPQVPAMPGFDTPMENNVHQTGLALGWSNDILGRNRLPNDLFDKWYEKGGPYRTLDHFVGEENRIFQQWLKHPGYDDYWQALVPTAEEYAVIDIPVLTTTGYYDGGQIAALRYWKLHHQYNKKADHYLVIGPWDHWGGQRKPATNLNGYDIGPVANVRMDTLALDWIDYVIKGTPKPALLQDKINLQVMGANQWFHAATMNDIHHKRWYLSTQAFSKDRYALHANKPNARQSLSQYVDFRDRAGQNNYFTPNIVNDELNPSGGLVFVTPPAQRDYQVLGGFSGQINVTINKRDVDLSIAFYEQQANGEYFYLTRYLGRASYADSHAQRKLLVPGEKTSLRFDNVRWTAKQIRKSSRLVFVVNVNKHPFEEINYGSGKAVADESLQDAGEPLRVQYWNDSFVEVPFSLTSRSSGRP